MKLAMKHMLSEFVVLLLAHHITHRAITDGPPRWRALMHWVRSWRPEPFGAWPRQREW